MTDHKTRIIEALQDGGALSLAELATATGLRHKDVREVLTTSNGSFHSELRTTDTDTDTSKRLRVFWLSDALALAAENELLLLGESATADELRGLRKSKLRKVAETFGVTGLRVKSTLAQMTDAIMALREDHSCACGEPVDAAGDVCTVCEEASQETFQARPLAASTGTGTGSLRKPNVELTLDAATLEAAEILAEDAKSARAAQRELAKLLAETHDGFIAVETLRTLLRRFGRLNKANFTVNMKKDEALFERVESEGKLAGWRLK